jgi:hypothetical protein
VHAEYNYFELKNNEQRERQIRTRQHKRKSGFCTHALARTFFIFRFIGASPIGAHSLVALNVANTCLSPLQVNSTRTNHAISFFEFPQK